MISLLDLQTKKHEIKKKLKALTNGQMVYSPEINRLTIELEQTEEKINVWGTNSDSIYRII